MTKLQDRTGHPCSVRVNLASREEVIDGTVASASRDNWDCTMEMEVKGLFNPGGRRQEKRNKGIKTYSECRKHLARCRSRQNTDLSSKLAQARSPWPWQRWEEKAEGRSTPMVVLIWITVIQLFLTLRFSYLHSMLTVPETCYCCFWMPEYAFSTSTFRIKGKQGIENTQIITTERLHTLSNEIIKVF